MPTINRPLIGVNNNDEHYEALVKRQTTTDKNHDTSRNYAAYSNRVYCSSSMRRWWTVDHGTIVGKGDHNHIDRSYTICITKTGWLITRNSKHVKPTQITTKQYLSDQLDKHMVMDPLEDILKQIENQHL